MGISMSANGQCHREGYFGVLGVHEIEKNENKDNESKQKAEI